MTNEQYLVVSYFVVGCFCILLAIGTHALLRGSFSALGKALPDGKLGLIVRKVFPVSFVLSALSGFFSVTFPSCEKKTYADVVADRAYLIFKNQEQMAAAMVYLCMALLLWSLFISIGFLMTDKKKK